MLTVQREFDAPAVGPTAGKRAGSSMRAAGLRLDQARAGCGSWSWPSQRTVDKHPLEYKQRWIWEKTATAEGARA